MAVTTNMGDQNYVPYKQKQSQLSEIIKRSSDAISVLNMENYTKNLQKLSGKIENDSFKIQIVGTFKNGKSTFINSFLGEEILPAYALPATCVINEVKYGSQKKALVHFCNPITKEMRIKGIPERAYSHMKKYNMKDIPPLEIPYDEIKQYVTIPLGEDPKTAMMESPYERVELFWPMELLKNGVEIIDSPGLNEAEARTKVTMEYLAKADAIIFLLTADKLLSQDEMDFIQYNMKANGFDKPFFIVNKFDLIRPREQKDIKSYIIERLRQYTEFGEGGFYFVSARDALDGKLDSDMDMYNKSGMPEFEKRLSEFLTREKGLAKLSQPAREVKRILSSEALYKVIPERRSGLEQSLDEVKKKHEMIKPVLKDLQAKKELLRERLNNKIILALPEIKRCVNQHISDLSKSIPAWSAESSPSIKLNKYLIIPSKENQERAISEISDYVNNKVEIASSEWKKNVLSPLLDEKTQEIFGSVESDLEKLFVEIDNIQLKVSGNNDIEPQNIPVWKRVAGVAGGLMLGDVGLAFSGGVNGIGKEFAKTLAIELGGGFLLGLLGIANPITLAALVIGTIIFTKSSSDSKAMQKLKIAVSDAAVRQLGENKDSICEDLLKNVSDKYNELADIVVTAVDVEIKEVDNQLTSIRRELEKGSANVDAKKKELADCENSVKALIAEADDFVDSLMKSIY